MSAQAPRVAIIAGMTRDRVIGRDNALPWKKIKDDLPNFRRLTEKKTVIMGRKTFEAIGRALPNRHNVIVSFEPATIAGCTVCTSLDEAISKAKEFGTDIFIIGGASIYEQMLPKVDLMYLSFIKKDYSGNKYFPTWNEQEWERSAEQEFDEFTFVTFKRKGL
jgi:dihydrofolate reductase